MLRSWLDGESPDSFLGEGLYRLDASLLHDDKLFSPILRRDLRQDMRKLARQSEFTPLYSPGNCLICYRTVGVLGLRM